MLLVGGIVVGMLLFITAARPQIFGAAWVRWTGFLRFWERRMVQSKEGYIAVKDAKIDQLRDQQREAIDTLAAQRVELRRLQEQCTILEQRENALLQRKEVVMADFEKLTEGTKDYSDAVATYDKTERELEQLHAQQNLLEGELEALQQEIEQVAPYIAEIADKIGKTEMEKQLGALRHDVTNLREARAQRLNRLSFSTGTTVDALEEQADRFLEQKVERGKVLEEYGTSSPATEKYDRKAREKSAADRLKAELAARRGAKETPPTSTASETLTRRG